MWRVSYDFVAIIKGKNPDAETAEDHMENRVKQILEDHYERAP